MRPQMPRMRGAGVIPGATFAFLLGACGPSGAESQTTRFGFERDAEGWESIPPPATPADLRVTPDSASGTERVLEVRYRVEKGKIAGIRRVVERVSGAGIRVRLKTESATTLVIGVIEKDGSAYNHVLFTGASEWQRVSAPFGAFQLAEDSKDENGRLDVGQIGALVIVDAAGFTSDGVGERRLWVADYEIPGALETEESSRGASPPRLEFRFENGTEGWTVIPPPGGAPARLRVTRDAERDSPAPASLELEYRVEERKVAGVLRPVSGGVAGDAVRMLLKTEPATMVVLGLVERDGSSYNHIVRTQAGDWQEVEVPLSNFSLADDSRDENGRLDLEQIHALVVGDAAGFVGEPGGEHRLSIGKYEIVSRGESDLSSARYLPLLATGLPADSGARATAGVTYPPGRFDRGFLADAPGELVTLPVPDLERGEGTIELWISPQFDVERGVRDFSGLVTMQAEPFASNFRSSLLLVYSGARQIVFLVNADTERAISTPRLGWKAGEWHHLAASWGPRGRRLYLDGRMVAENRETAGPGALADLVVGNQTWTLLSQKFADTVIDELRLSSVQRSDEEIARAARADRPLLSDDRTVALEHFDGSPHPPLTLSADGEPFHARERGKSSRLTVVAPAPLPSGSRLTYGLTTPGGELVHSGTSSEGAIPVPALDAPGFYRVELRLEAEGKAVNVGEGWVRVRDSVAPRSERSAPPLFGFSGSTVDSHDREEFFGSAAAAGARSVRMPFEWAEIEPRKGDFVWERYDRIVAWADLHGIELVPTLFWENPQPAWAGRGKAADRGSDETYPPEDLNAWGDFVFRVVDRYKDRIRWWIPANEPNLPRYWFPRPDPKAYVALLRATREAARRADPEAKILGGSVSGVDLRFLEEAFRAGALDHADAVGIHPYRSPHAPDERVPINIAMDPGSQPGTFLDGLRAAHQLMEKYGGASKTIWLDEVGQPYRDDFIIPGWGVSEETAASYLVKMYVDSKASGLVERVLWYSFWGGDYGSFALLKPDGSPTLPFVAFAALAERLGSAEVTGEGGRGRDVRSVKLSAPGETVEVLWSLRGANEVALEAGERAFDLYGFPLEEANRSRRLTVTSAPCWILRSGA